MDPIVITQIALSQIKLLKIYRRWMQDAKFAHIARVWETNRRYYLERQVNTHQHTEGENFELFDLWIWREGQLGGKDFNKKWVYAMLDWKESRKIGDECLRLALDLQKLKETYCGQKTATVRTLIQKFTFFIRAAAAIPLIEAACGMDMWDAAADAGREAEEFRSKSQAATNAAQEIAVFSRENHLEELEGIIHLTSQGFHALNQYNPQECLMYFKRAMTRWGTFIM